MTKSETTAELRAWLKEYYWTNGKYKNIWDDVGSHPLDKLLLRLASLYLHADPQEKTKIEKIFSGRTDRLLQLIYFIRRISKSIISPDQEDLVKAGLIVAAIEGGRFDFRDTIISLIILRYASERAGIDFKGLIENMDSVLPSTVRSLFLNVKNQNDIDVTYTVKRHGPPGWF